VPDPKLRTANQVARDIESELRVVLQPQRVRILTCSTKQEALNALIECLATAPQIKDRDELAKGIFHREELMSTGIGMGIAVPHVRLSSVESPVMCAGVCREGIADYESLDGRPVHLIFMIAAGRDQHAQYLKLLSFISKKLKDENLREALIQAGDAQTFYEILTKQDR